MKGVAFFRSLINLSVKDEKNGIVRVEPKPDGGYFAHPISIKIDRELLISLLNREPVPCHYSLYVEPIALRSSRAKVLRKKLTEHPWLREEVPELEEWLATALDQEESPKDLREKVSVALKKRGLYEDIKMVVKLQATEEQPHEWLYLVSEVYRPRRILTLRMNYDREIIWWMWSWKKDTGVVRFIKLVRFPSKPDLKLEEVKINPKSRVARVRQLC